MSSQILCDVISHSDLGAFPSQFSFVLVVYVWRCGGPSPNQNSKFGISSNMFRVFYANLLCSSSTDYIDAASTQQTHIIANNVWSEGKQFRSESPIVVRSCLARIVIRFVLVWHESSRPSTYISIHDTACIFNTVGKTFCPKFPIIIRFLLVWHDSGRIFSLASQGEAHGGGNTLSLGVVNCYPIPTRHLCIEYLVESGRIFSSKHFPICIVDSSRSTHFLL